MVLGISMYKLPAFEYFLFRKIFNISCNPFIDCINTENLPYNKYDFRSEYFINCSDNKLLLYGFCS